MNRDDIIRIQGKRRERMMSGSFEEALKKAMEKRKQEEQKKK